MGDFEKLLEAAKPFCERIKASAEAGSEICVITHIDADGITSGSIIATALSRLGSKFCLRTVPDMNGPLLESLKNENHDFVVISDLGAGWLSQIRQSFGDNCVIIDHHQLPAQEITTDDSNQIFNAWKFGVDGGRDISAGGMNYVVAYGLDAKNHDLSALAVVSAVADRQDQGEKRALLGVNSQIVKHAEKLGLVSVDLDIMLAGRETRPCHEALAYTSYPYIEGLTWHPDSCYNLLSNGGIKLRSEGRWRTPSELSQEEKSTLVDSVAKHVTSSSRNMPSVIDNLVGYVYTLTSEDKRSPLRDAREFATLLNACGRMSRAGLGVAVCFGDRNRLLGEAEKIALEYRSTLRANVSSLFAERWRILDQEGYVLINGDGLVAADMLGAISSLLSGSPLMSGKLVFIWTSISDGTNSIKFSSRRAAGSVLTPNLGTLMRHCATSVGGTGGGHVSAAGCRIPSSSINQFTQLLQQSLVNPEFVTRAQV